MIPTDTVLCVCAHEPMYAYMYTSLLCVCDVSAGAHMHVRGFRLEVLSPLLTMGGPGGSGQAGRAVDLAWE